MTPNQHLEPLARVVGEWTTEGSHPMMPGETLHGEATFDWIEDGAFLRVRAHVDHPKFPRGVSIVGCDDGRPGAGTILYFDSRGVAREYKWTLAGDVWTWSRDDAKLAQRMQHTIARDGATIVCRGEMSRDGGAWEPDLSLTYSRKR